MSSSAESASGARPRFVCRMTPVALITLRREKQSDWRTSRSTALATPESASSRPSASRSPVAISSRNLESTSRADSVTAACPSREMRSAIAGARNSSSTEGSLRYRSVLAPDFTGEIIPCLRGRGRPRHIQPHSTYLHQPIRLLPTATHVNQRTADVFLGDFRIWSGQNGSRFVLGGFEQLTVANYVCHPKAGQARLLCAKKLTRPTKLQIELSDFETIIGANHCIQAAFAFFGNFPASH